MVRSTRIIHKDREFLIQENRTDQDTRTITFLGRPEASAVAEGTGDLQPIKTDHGDWIPLGKWERGSLELMHAGAKKDLSLLRTLLNKYLKDGDQSDEPATRRVYYYVEMEGRLKFDIVNSHPNGLAVNIFSKKGLARKCLGDEVTTSGRVRIRQTSNLMDFLIKAADEGFVGAVLDYEEPIFFCLDKDEDIVFLRLTLDQDDEVEDYILRKDGTWDRYDGDRDIEFYLDQDACDKNMVRNLGEIPFIGHDEITHAWTIEFMEKKGTPFPLPAMDSPYAKIAGDSSLVLFRSKQNALDYLLERGLFTCETVRVNHLARFLTDARRNGQTVLFEPFGHRAASGTLWINGQEIILDSFSGFWIMEQDWRFVKTA